MIKYNNQIKGVFFDLYGTLLIFHDYDSANKEWINCYYELIGKPYNISFDQIEILCEKIISKDVPKNNEHQLTTYESKIKWFLEEIGLILPIGKLKELANVTIQKWQEQIELDKESIATIENLKKKYTVGLITNFDHTPHIYKVLMSTNLKSFFDFVIVSDEVNCKKPEGKIFELGLSKCGLRPNEVVYIGDNPEDDIEGALNAGLSAILIDRGKKTNSATAKEVNAIKINSLTELTKIL
jgi:putative hydrolase of the HAD superfamily